MGDSVRELVAELFVLQLKNNGIPSYVSEKLPSNIKKSLILKNNKYYLSDKLRKKIKVVVSGGVFDILHYGHIHTLKKAKSYGDVLIVVIARDENVYKLKGKFPVHDQNYRKLIINEIKPVDLAIVGFKDKHRLMNKIEPDIVVFGYDQQVFGCNCKVVKLKEPVNDDKFKSSKIKDYMGI